MLKLVRTDFTDMKRSSPIEIGENTICKYMALLHRKYKADCIFCNGTDFYAKSLTNESLRITVYLKRLLTFNPLPTRMLLENSLIKLE